jgi:glycerol-3-phosphate O-acyltransferase
MDFYRCLNDIGGTYVLVPITINYERIPEQRILAEEACGSNRKIFCLSDLMVWLKVRTASLCFHCIKFCSE